jgi:hypothetical protein
MLFGGVLFCMTPPFGSPGWVVVMELPLLGVPVVLFCANAPVLHSNTVDNARAVLFIEFSHPAFNSMDVELGALSHNGGKRFDPMDGQGSGQAMARSRRDLD